MTRRTLGVLAATVAAVTAACGGGGDGDDDDPGDTAPAVDARLDVDVERVDTAVHVAWTVTNNGDEPLLVFDNRRGDEAEGELLQGAYVTGGDDGDRVEVSRRVFPVPDDLEGAQDYVVTAGELAPGASESYVDNVAVPPRYAPAASEGGGAPLPDDATTRGVLRRRGAGRRGRAGRPAGGRSRAVLGPPQRGQRGRPDAAVQRPVRPVGATPSRRRGRA